MKEIQIPNGYFHLWQTYMQKKGVNALDLAEQYGFKLQLESILAAPIAQQSSYTIFQQCIQFSQHVLGMTSITFEMAQYIKAEHFGVVGYMATRSQSISESLGYMIRFSRLVIDGEEITPMQMHQEGNHLTLSWPYLSDEYILINELNSAFIIAMARQILPLNAFPLKKISFAHAAQMPIFQYQKFYACDVIFNHSQYEFELSLGSLDLRIEQADPSLMQLLVKQAEEAIASKPQHENIARQLQLMIAEYLRVHQQAPKVDDLASELFVSGRTLQRQLKEMGTSFKAILENERMQQCDKLLAKDFSLSDIANHLGYSDQSALARAYKSVRGKTLLEVRAELKSTAKPSL